MESIIDHLVTSFERLFPDQAHYSAVVRAGINARTARFQAIMEFYDEHRDDGEEALARVGGICSRVFRDALLAEAGKTSDSSGFMLKTFVRLNHNKVRGFVDEALASPELANTVLRYPFIKPLLVEASNPEWLSSLVGL